MKNNERDTVDFDKMLLPDLKAEAKARKIKGFSAMKKAELVAALKADSEPEPAMSVVEAIVTGIRNDREARSNKGRYAGSQGKRTRKTLPEDKEYAYRLQRGSDSAKLTPKQAKRVRKTEAKLYNQNRNTACFGMGARPFTFA